MNSNENTLNTAVQELTDYLTQDSRARYLADVLCAWDHELCDWLPGASIVIRTELRDITLWWRDGIHLEVSTEPVCDYQQAPAAHLRWKQYVGLKSFIGSSIVSFTLDTLGEQDALWILFQNGRSARISPQGVMTLTSLAYPASA